MSGLGGLGLEIAKNVVLAGCKELILHDEIKPKEYDLASQFFLNEESTKEDKNRATLSINKLRELNPYVKISLIGETI